MGRTQVDALIDTARARTGLDDLGPESYRDGLDIYWASVVAEARLTELGTAMVSETVIAALTNRLRVIDWANRHPEVREEPIDAPLIVVGMFRAGTTLLSYLLDTDPANRSLLRWEAGDSVPPPTPDTLRSGPRVDAVRASAEMLDQLNPAVRTVHHEEADGPTECISVMAQDFKSLSWEAISNVPAYSRWLLGTDQRSAYEYHRLVLQILQSGGARGRWTLKSPHHAIALDDLVAVYPDARLVLIHRDPVELAGSVCSLIHTLSSTFSDADHRRYIAEHWLDMLDTSLSRVEDFRRRRPEHPVVEVLYTDLVGDPVGTVASMHQQLGAPWDPLSAEARAGIAAHVAAHPKGSRGAHRYDLGDFGLDEGAVRERFAGRTPVS